MQYCRMNNESESDILTKEHLTIHVSYNLFGFRFAEIDREKTGIDKFS